MLTVVTGPMFSGKSSTLISMATSHVIAGHKVLAFKPSNDTRYDDIQIVSHVGEKFAAIAIEPQFPSQIVDKVTEYELINGPGSVDVVCVDETQFFYSEQIKTVVRHLLLNRGKTIILSGLAQDSYGEPFGAMPYLLAIADDIIHLKAVCSQSKKIGAATRTFRKDTTNSQQVVVGGIDMYEPRSFKEWLKGQRLK